MAFPNPGGRPKEKPFRDALNMEIKDAGDDHKALRRIARALLQNAYEGKMDAIKEVADRLDGKPVAEVDATITINPIQALLDAIDGRSRTIPSA